jgi:hypothetical protein
MYLNARKSKNFVRFALWRVERRAIGKHDRFERFSPAQESSFERGRQERCGRLVKARLWFVLSASAVGSLCAARPGDEGR